MITIVPVRGTLFLLLAANLVGMSSVWAIPQTADRYRAADEAFRRRSNEEEARRALQIYRNIFQDQPENFEIAYRVSMVNFYVGLYLTRESEERQKIFQEGEKSGRIAIEKNSDCAACYYWTAMNRFGMLEPAGFFKMALEANEIRKLVKESLKLDPAYAEGGGYRLLGMLELKVPAVVGLFGGLFGLEGGSNALAEGYFKKAIETVPDEPLNYLSLANFYKDRLGDPEKAHGIARKGVSFQGLPVDRVESRHAIEDLKHVYNLGAR